MKQFVLVACVDFQFKGAEFRRIADTRRKFLMARMKGREEARFTTMDVNTGEVEVRTVTFPKGKRTETVKSTTPFDPVRKSDYTTVDGHTRLKPGLTKVMSITDVYATIRKIGADDPGTLAEFSVFGHSTMVGPMLVNSTDDRSEVVQIPNRRGGGFTTITRSLSGTTKRDPDDKDARASLDFQAPTMDATALGVFRKAFHKNGFSWLWGCSHPEDVAHSMFAMEKAPSYRPKGLKDDDVLVMDAVTTEDVDSLDEDLSDLIGKFPKPRSSIRVKFKFLKYAFCKNNQASYAAALATASGRQVRAAGVGTWANYDTSGDMLMHVDVSNKKHNEFFANYLDFAFDPEKRGYVVYPPNMACPVPSVP